MKLQVQEYMSRGITDPSIIAANTMLSKKQVRLAQEWIKSGRYREPRAKKTKPEVVTIFGVRL